MKYIPTFESFLNEGIGDYYLQISFSLLGSLGHSIDVGITTKNEHMGELGASDLSELKSPKLDNLIKDLRLWKVKDKTGKIDTAFLDLVEKNMNDLGFTIGKFRSRLKAPYVITVKDADQAETDLAKVIDMLNKTYNQYEPSVIPDRGRPINVKGPIIKLVNDFEGGRGDYERELANFASSIVGTNTKFYLDDYFDRDEPLVKANDHYTKGGKVKKEESFGILKATAYDDGTLIIRVGDTDRRLSWDLKTGDALFAAKK
jgi:hypothetical protein